MGAASRAIALRTPETVRRRGGHCKRAYTCPVGKRANTICQPNTVSGTARLQMEPIAVASHRESSEYGLRTRSNTTC